MLFSSKKKRIPIGYENFAEIIQNNFYYVDKTMLIYDLLTRGGKNNLITRPRRFGKTLNLSMLKSFFDITEQSGRELFKGLDISEHYDEVGDLLNNRPVISISLKDAQGSDFATVLKNIHYEIHDEFNRYGFIFKSDKVSDTNKEKAMAVMQLNGSETDIAYSLRTLCVSLKEYYELNTVVLIDEYDVPLENAYFNGFYDKMVSFIRTFFSASLKTNNALELSVITGCLRISKESIFTGLNNLETNTILSGIYNSRFGFVQSEIDELLSYYDIEDKRDAVKEWYDGYLFGGIEVYNPWSVINQIKAWTSMPAAPARSWWVNSSSNSIIKELISHANAESRELIGALLNGSSIGTHISETVTYEDLENENENIWSFMLFTGYLKPNGDPNIDDDGIPTYDLVIPNKEILNCYKAIIHSCFTAQASSIDKSSLYHYLICADAQGFSNEITRLLKLSISYYDNAESFYHGLISGLLAGNPDYVMKSNREAGNGRCDLLLYEYARFNNAIILEFKICGQNEDIDTAAQRALNQIDERGYTSEAKELGYKNIIKYGIAFKGKICCATVKKEEQ